MNPKLIEEKLKRDIRRLQLELKEVKRECADWEQKYRVAISKNEEQERTIKNLKYCGNRDDSAYYNNR